MTLAEDIIQSLSYAADPTKSAGMKAYMKGKFDFYGVVSPIRKDVCKHSYAHSRKLDHDILIDQIHVLWQRNERECQYAALDILIKNKKRLLSIDIEDVTHWLTQKSWWDTIDGLASHIVGELFAKDDNLKKKHTAQWLMSDNIWLNRTCLIYQLKYKEKTDFNSLQSYILTLKHKNEFFIQKAIGWSLRQHGKYDADAVLKFVRDIELSNLARREAVRLINR